jgi:hypothetical protein
VENGIMVDDLTEIDSIRGIVTIVWSPMINKTFKLKLEDSLRIRIEEDDISNIFELTKRTRKIYVMGSDFTLIDKMGFEHHRDGNAFQYRKDL